MSDDTDTPLCAVFAGEARAHLAQLDAGLGLLAAGGPRAPVLATMLDALHTLGGAARAVELRELEWLCQALERVLGVIAAGDARPAPQQLGLLAEAVALGRMLSGEGAAGRCRKPLTLIGQLDALSRELAMAGAAVTP